MAKKEGKKLEWIKPKLEYLSGPKTTLGSCGGGSGDVDSCFPSGSLAGTGPGDCVDGAGRGLPSP